MDSLEGIDSRFRHAILAAKRAKQLVGGAKKKIDMVAENPLTIAIEEIKEGKINFHILEEEEAKRFPIEEEEVQEENTEINEIDRDLFFKPNPNSSFDEEDEEDENDEDMDDIEDEDEEDDDEDEDDNESEDYSDDYDEDDEDGMTYDEDEEDD